MQKKLERYYLKEINKNKTQIGEQIEILILYN